jgi:hypothetical protein
MARFVYAREFVVNTYGTLQVQHCSTHGLQCEWRVVGFLCFYQTQGRQRCCYWGRCGRNLGQPEKGTLLRVLRVLVKVLRLDLKKVDKFQG